MTKSHKSPPAPHAHPKVAVDGPSNLEKDPNDWVSGDEPMTGAQASYLKTLTEEAGKVGRDQGYAEGLTKAEASRRIDALKQRIGLETHA